MSNKIAEKEIEGLCHEGDSCFFEYHCWESDESGDAELWHRSHQRVTILGLAENDGYYPPNIEPTCSQTERYEMGLQILYRVQFADGFEGVVFEDELLDSEDDYCRPAPTPR